jgi:hypothetical protein
MSEGRGGSVPLKKESIILKQEYMTTELKNIYILG